jgi:hypothetical protein
MDILSLYSSGKPRSRVYSVESDYIRGRSIHADLSFVICHLPFDPLLNLVTRTDFSYLTLLTPSFYFFGAPRS